MREELDVVDLYKDLGHVLFGTALHRELYRLFPPRGINNDVLEAGCGSGKLGIAYALQGCRVRLLDIDPQAIEYAKRLTTAAQALSGQIPYVAFDLGTIHRIPYRDNEFDMVFGEGVVTRWPDDETRQNAINEMARVSREAVIIVGGNGLNPRAQEPDRTVHSTYEGVPPQRRHFSPDELFDKMTKAGLKGVNIDLLGMEGNPSLVPELAVYIVGYGRK